MGCTYTNPLAWAQLDKKDQFPPDVQFPTRNKGVNLRSFGKPLSDQSFLTQSVLAFYHLGPAVFQMQPRFNSQYLCAWAGETTEETCPLDVQTITNDQLLENIFLMKPSMYSLTHLKAD